MTDNSHTAANSSVAGAVGNRWRTPGAVIACGCLISILTFGPRSTLGFFLPPLSTANHWGRDVFALAVAWQNLIWGIAQPIGGIIADRYGTVRVLGVGGLLYCVGLVLMAYATSVAMLDLATGLLIGVGLAGSSYNIVLAAFGKVIPLRWRSLAFGLGTAAGSFGQFFFAPLAILLMDAFGWQRTLVIFGVCLLAVLPLAFMLAAPPTPVREDAAHSLRQALGEAFRMRSYILLVLGFFTCGFQIQFITVHLPAYLLDRGLSADVGGWTIAVIGLFNIIGSLSAGWLGDRMPKRYLLSMLYFFRAAVIFAFISFPVTPLTCLAFGAGTGLTWLATVPPTNGIIATVFGTRWLATLTGFAFFGHQVGGFLGIWLGGLVFDRTGSYNAIWWMAILLGILAGLVNVPIVEKPLPRLGVAPA